MDLPLRKIIHVDMDSFFASVEQLDRPELLGKPIAVGGIHRGVVAAASYEARKFGVRSAISSKKAQELCPELIFVQPRFERYKEISQIIRKIFHEYTDVVEPLSLDEAYLDVTENKKNRDSANEIAREIRQKIFETTGLTASAGISINKFLAKVASDIHKPNGQKTIHPQEVLDFLETLPIDRFYGIGKVTAAKMKAMGIHCGLDLKQKSLAELSLAFGKSGKHYYQVVRGIHLSEVNPHRIRKSLAVEETFWEDLQETEAIFDKLAEIAEELFHRMQRSNTQGRTLTLKIKYADFSQFTRSKTELKFIQDKESILILAKNLWELRPLSTPIRLLGLSLSNLNNEPTQSKFIQLKIPFEEFHP
ncbi:MAG TPA: DNA polymerase IV [Moheibacter sp.]|nr:DNA polymerase IV [Moheibacter sp.]